MRQAQLVKEDHAQLLGGVDIEFLPRQIIDLLLQLGSPRRQGLAKRGKRRRVHPAAGDLHIRQHGTKGKLRRLEEVPQIFLPELGGQRLI